MVFEDYSKKDGAVIVYTGEGKGKTSAALGMMVRALGAGYNVAFIQFIKQWEVSEDQFIRNILPVFKERLTFYKGGLGFYDAGDLSADATKSQHIDEAKKTFDFALSAATCGEYHLVICDEINNAAHDGLIKVSDLNRLISEKDSATNICLTGRNFPKSLINKVDIATNMTKLKHHFDDKVLANEGIDY